ncbi:dolichyl-diphosphooligosaccharide-protein glycotransferase KNAG_0E02000 [Huiozyma naganishii CBS 8797]|uniref:Ribophorin II C-terminal domain-containing protein n=1 Tax=Huiozyma naganishii (strain ATCC MYA-139 / BCRC 22969 / CBS 8797 / KCTC 17520 / NBRC 10181 / NCYC 3082 / Yp74L-3) TaxID=1071383 RepID=J7RZ46_HUIN7|nr:hypothetical protein KNAG_0E02000 [Kazachstania naganishii CBS 8797]CCK70462.1 hypothetical protein KNAG_0E02000 [Kazachstania naganishii CBS 8797]
MQLTQVVTVLLCLAFNAAAFSVKNGKILSSDNQEAARFRSLQEKPSEPIIVSSGAESVAFSFSLVDYETVPEQLSLLIGVPEKHLEIALKPTVETQGDSKASVTFKITPKDLPSSLQYYAKKDNAGKLCATLIVASPDTRQDNFVSDVFDLLLDYEIGSAYNEPERLGPQREIRYTFPEPPKMVSPIVAQLFAVVIVLVGFSLFVSWVVTGCITFDNIPKGLNFVYFVATVGSIAGFEAVFTRYYLGTSIFDTLHAAMYLGTIGLVMGTKFLRNVGPNI